ncbi:MAG TPA: PAS domain-containing protein [Novosphingobium sp.]|nr:PAS domain-containing protein [Novosphingobium sp.]
MPTSAVLTHAATNCDALRRLSVAMDATQQRLEALAAAGQLAHDITDQRRRAAESEAKVRAIERAQATTEFDLDGKMISANDNFPRWTGYSLREIVGQHHSMFCSPDHIRSAEYRAIWIQATYNPIVDLTGKPVRIVKSAFGVTEQVELSENVTGQIARWNCAAMSSR